MNLNKALMLCTLVGVITSCTKTVVEPTPEPTPEPAPKVVLTALGTSAVQEATPSISLNQIGAHYQVRVQNDVPVVWSMRYNGITITDPSKAKVFWVSATGKITLIAAGTATLVATSQEDPSLWDSIDINVVAVANTATISGTISKGVAAQSLNAQNMTAPIGLVQKRTLVSDATADSWKGSWLVGYSGSAEVKVDGLEEVSRSTGFGVYRATGSKEQLKQAFAELAQNPNITTIEPNVKLSSLAIPTDTRYTEQWSHQSMGNEAAWGIAKGDGQVIAVLDDGILGQHPDIKDKLLPGYDFITNQSGAEDTDPESTFHGTHVAGIAAASSNNAQGIAGVAWNAKILPVRVLSTTEGSLDGIIKGIRWAAGLSVSGIPNNPNKASIINMSLGAEDSCSSLLQQAIDDATAAGATVVVASGNYGLPFANYIPASCNNVVVVGSHTKNGAFSTTSNQGDQILAPGGDVVNKLAVDPILSLGKSGGQLGYVNMVGTSMAAPAVSGAAALLKSMYPKLTTAEVRQLLWSTATPVSNCAGCAGRINTTAALKALQTQGRLLIEGAGTLNMDINSKATVSLALTSTNSATPITLEVAVPSGITASLPTSVAGGSSTQQLNISSSAAGTYKITVKATQGAKTFSFDVIVTVESASVYAGVLIEKSFYAVAEAKVAANNTYSLTPPHQGEYSIMYASNTAQVVYNNNGFGVKPGSSNINIVVP